MTIKTVTTLLVGASSELLADSLLKSWSLSGARTTYSFGLLVYTLSAIIWASTLHDEPMSKSSVFFFAANGMLCVLMGVMYFGEKLTPLGWAGIAAGILSVVLLGLAGNPEGALGGR